LYGFLTSDCPVLELQELSSVHPLATVASSEWLPIGSNGVRVKARAYPWGVVEVEDPEVSDFRMLRRLLFQLNLLNLKDSTHDQIYEAFRDKKLETLGFKSLQETPHIQIFGEPEDGLRVAQTEALDSEERRLRRELERKMGAKLRELDVQEQVMRDKYQALDMDIETKRKETENQLKELQERQRFLEEEKSRQKREKQVSSQSSLSARGTLRGRTGSGLSSVSGSNRSESKDSTKSNMSKVRKAMPWTKSKD
jgi:septin 7